MDVLIISTLYWFLLGNIIMFFVLLVYSEYCVIKEKEKRNKETINFIVDSIVERNFEEE